MADDIRDALVASMTELETSSGQQEEQAPEAPSAEPASTERDTSGRFTPRVPAKDEVSENKEQSTQAPEPVAAAPAPQAAPQPAQRAPVSWTPEAREEWAKLPPRAQQEVIRREAQINEALRTTADARSFQQQMSKLVAPYMPLIQAENATPAQAIDSLFRTASILRTAPPQQRAQAVAEMILAHNVDVSMLDTIIANRLQGRPGPGPDPMSAVMQQIDQRLRPVQDFMQSIRQRRQEQSQMTQKQAEQTLQEFFDDPQNEFAQDVADDMADLLEVAARRGHTLSLQDAYNRATLMHPTISKVLERRRLENGAAQQTAAASRARQAAVSVSDSGAPSQSGDEGSGDDIRSALQASIRHHSGRR